MKMQTQQRGGVVVIRPNGPIVAEETDELRKGFLEAIHKNLGRVVLDASAITFVDSQGLEALLGITCELAQSGKALRICAPGETLKEIMELTGVSSEFEYFEDLTSAVRSFL